MSVVWIIDADQWPRAMLRAELIERGFDAVGYPTVGDAIESLLLRPPNAIVVDLRGQPPRLVERLLAIGVPVLVIAGMAEINDLPEGAWSRSCAGRCRSARLRIASLLRFLQAPPKRLVRAAERFEGEAVEVLPVRLQDHVLLALDRAEVDADLLHRADERLVRGVIGGDELGRVTLDADAVGDASSLAIVRRARMFVCPIPWSLMSPSKLVNQSGMAAGETTR